MKRCYLCQKDLKKSEFSKDKSKSDGLQSRCRMCNKRYRKKYYNKEKEYEKLKERRIKNRNIVAKFKEKNPCIDCDKFYPHYVMQYDHLDDKDRIISDAVRDWGLERILKEIEKCDLVCANCHAARTYKRQFEPDC